MIKKYLTLSLFVLAMASAVCSTAFAAGGSANVTADNHYQIYVSKNDDSALGDFIGQSDKWGLVGTDTCPGCDWQTPENWNLPDFEIGNTYYIHIIAVSDPSTKSGLLGDFSLNNANFFFDNGTQSLLTNATDWKVFTDAFGGTQAVNTDIGTNGVAPWGNIAGVNSNAKWIWDNNGNTLDTTRYFSARINSVVTPEPVSSALFLLGGSALAARRLKKKKA